jgi:hypothetical protein
MLPSAYFSHRSAQRMRLRIPERRGDLSYFIKIQEALKSWDSSLNIQITPLTSSVLIEPSLDADKLKFYAEGLALFKLKSIPIKVRSKIPSIEELTQRPIFAGVLMGLGVLQMCRGQSLAAGSTLFMDALRLWSQRKTQA